MKSGSKNEDTSLKEKHSCCKKSLQRPTLRSYAAGLLAASLACLCCSIPLIFLILGLSTTSSFLNLHKYHAMFDTVSGITLFAGLIYIWRKHNSKEKSFFKSKEFWFCLITVFFMYGAVSLAIKTLVSPIVSSASNSTNIHEDHR